MKSPTVCTAANSQNRALSLLLPSSPTIQASLLAMTAAHSPGGLKLLRQAQILPKTTLCRAVWRTITARKPKETRARRPRLEHPAKSAERAPQNGGLYQAAGIFNDLSDRKSVV